MLTASGHQAPAWSIPAWSIPRYQRVAPVHNVAAAVAGRLTEPRLFICGKNSKVTAALPRRGRGEQFEDIDDDFDPANGGSFGRAAEYLAPSVIFPELAERLEAQAAQHAARNTLAEHQAALDEAKAKAKGLQRELEEVHRNLATMQSILDHAHSVLEASRREQFRGHAGRKHNGEPGGLSIPRRRRPVAEAAKRLRWVTKMQARAELAMDDFPD